MAKTVKERCPLCGAAACSLLTDHRFPDGFDPDFAFCDSCKQYLCAPGVARGSSYGNWMFIGSFSLLLVATAIGVESAEQFWEWTAIALSVLAMLIGVEAAIWGLSGRHSPPVRLLRTKMGWPAARHPPRHVLADSINPSGALGALAIGAAASLLQRLQRHYLFLQELPPQQLDDPVKQALERFEPEVSQHSQLEARLERATEILGEDRPESADLAMFLVASTLEAGLKQLRDRHHVSLREDESKGMAGLAEALVRHGVIDQVERGHVLKHAGVRNIVVHGGINKIDKDRVRGEMEFVRSILRRYRIA